VRLGLLEVEGVEVSVIHTFVVGARRSLSHSPAAAISWLWEWVMTRMTLTTAGTHHLQIISSNASNLHLRSNSTSITRQRVSTHPRTCPRTEFISNSFIFSCNIRKAFSQHLHPQFDNRSAISQALHLCITLSTFTYLYISAELLGYII
jgi:hypothetical protein